ncbi:Os11g0134950 [Oryza sativa Japonica Group]|uniref:Os11g0134950 protein n=1 Tax=Oryza sativa subsp. japonica TaxID=39947 RepID=A0A0P0XZH2_ORYSJ|nr:hypothetical protein EE612_053356 [Oryza sativa]BAT12558.1 Os11g0134950 [Oryza sativa Japonica Group]
MPFRAPRRNLVAIAIQYFTLNPNRTMNTHTDKIENLMIGFLPIRSATTPQKSEAKHLPIIYDAPTKHNIVTFYSCMSI